MSDKPSKYELGDELLSAYLDGELSADERAAVEARLATDPAAQQVLHELKSVSQSVQALPTESLGRDMSEEIMRRAREAKPELIVRESAVVRGSPDPAPAPDRKSPITLGDTILKVRVFHSRRAWIWASLALAAGLLLMIVQSGDESANKLAPVAARNPEAAPTPLADEAGEPRRRELAISAVPKSPSQSPATVARDNELHDKIDSLATTMPASKTPGEAGGGRLSINRDGTAAAPQHPAASPAPNQLIKDEDKVVVNAGDASSTSTPSAGPAPPDKLEPTAQSTGRLGGTNSARGMAAEKQKSESISGSNPHSLVVVRVVAKPDALKNRSFERLLANNKIELEAQPAKSQLRSFGGLLAKPAQSESNAKGQSNKAAEVPADDSEMVLVEAPAPAIESCLEELNKNSNDFLSIIVREQPQPRDRFDANSTRTKKLAETTNGLSRFSRGTAATVQNDTIDPLYYFNSQDFDKPNDVAANGSPKGGSFGSEPDGTPTIQRETDDAKISDYKKQSPPDIRRARRIETWDIENPHPSEVAAATGRTDQFKSTGEKTNQPMSQRKPLGSAEAKPDSSANNIKVLFVLTSEASPPTSTPSTKPPK